MDEVADSNSVAPTTFSLSRFTPGGAFFAPKRTETLLWNDPLKLGITFSKI